MSTTKIQLENIKEKLLDLGLRGNSLLHFAPRGKKHIDIVEEKSEAIFNLLVQSEKKLAFLPAPEISVETEHYDSDIHLPTLNEYLIQSKGDARFTDLLLQTKLGPEELDVRLLKIDNEAKTIFQERGIDVIFLALGFLKWFESDSSSKERFAPLVLVPVELNRTSAGKGFKLKYTGLDLAENETLYAKIKNDFNIDLPREIEKEQAELSLSGYFQRISEAIEGLERYEVLEDKMALGFFSFGKFQMYKDLDSSLWPEDNQPSQNAILKQLFEDGFASSEESNAHFENDPIKFPEQLNLVKDADSTQTEAIIKVLKGKNLVIQGPPGTGKSQTITNLIAEAVARDMKVLFVAQKLTALEVVKDRLDQAHIGNSVLEIHSHKSRPRDVLDSLESTLFEDKPSVPERGAEKEKLKEIKTYLDAYADLVKKPINKTKFTFGYALGNYIRQKALLSDETLNESLDIEFYQKMDHQGWLKFKDDLALVFEKIFQESAPRENPFFGSKAIEVSPDLANSIHKDIQKLQGLLTQLLDQLKGLEEVTGLSQPEARDTTTELVATLQALSDSKGIININFTSKELKAKDNINNLLDLLNRFSDVSSICSEKFEQEALDKDVNRILELKKLIELKGGKWYSFMLSSYRKAKNDFLIITKSSQKYSDKKAIQALNDLIDYLRLVSQIKENEQVFSELFQDNWKGLSSDWIKLNKALSYAAKVSLEIELGSIHKDAWNIIDQLQNRIEQIEPYLPKVVDLYDETEKLHGEILQQLQFENQIKELGKPYYDQIQILQSRNASTGSLFQLAQLNRQLQKLEVHGAHNLIAHIYHYDKNFKELLTYIEYAFWKTLLNLFYQQEELISNFDRTIHEKFIHEFIDLDLKTFVHAQEYLVNSIHENLPSPSAAGEMSILRREMAKKRRILPVRRLLEKTGVIIQAIKPVFMMSPMSVATFLPPSKVAFDLVIFDEASQVTIPDAIGSILRAKQVIVVGDSKQMPPTSFFSKSIEVKDEDLDDDLTAEIESILDLFSAQGVDQSMLKWHYRSKHESLIFRSNQEFYDGKLFVFPSSGTLESAKGLRFIHTEGTFYDRSVSRTNKGEAKIVADHVKKHIETNPDLSLGVVAFSMAQKEAILFEVELLRRNNDQLEWFFNEGTNDEPFFVKNLENVQGDERDVIFISTGYGKTQTGALNRSFGPINQAGGERRLNVLMSRAKQQMVVFSNFEADELRTDHESPFGVKVLKRFLKYAQTGVIEIPLETHKEADSIFEVEVAKKIGALGYEVEPQVGSQGFFIDIAIRHPEKKGAYLLAVECDGASYHSSANARDRDRLRQAVLESVGWKFHRIWSTDWFRDEKGEIERLKHRIQEVLEQPEKSVKPKNIDIKPKIERIQRSEEDDQAHHEYEAVNQNDAQKFSEWVFYDDFDDIPEDEVIKWIAFIIEKETPIHKEVLMNRVLIATNFNRLGGRIKKRITMLLKRTIRYSDYIMDGDFAVKPGKEIVVRDRSNLHNNDRKIEYVPLDEIEMCIKEVVKESLSIDEESLVREVASRLGFNRLTEKTKNYFQECVSSSEEKQDIVKSDDNYILNNY